MYIHTYCGNYIVLMFWSIMFEWSPYMIPFRTTESIANRLSRFRIYVVHTYVYMALSSSASFNFNFHMPSMYALLMELCYCSVLHVDDDDDTVLLSHKLNRVCSRLFYDNSIFISFKFCTERAVHMQTYRRKMQPKYWRRWLQYLMLQLFNMFRSIS